MRGVWSFPSLVRPGDFVVGEVVKAFCRVSSSFSGSLAGRGGGGRRSWSCSTRFCWCWWRWLSSTVLLRPALVARGAASGGGQVLVVAGLGAAVSDGSWAVLGRRRCGRARSVRQGSVEQLRRRTTVAVIYKAWRRSLSGGKRYGDDGDA